jgi:hypothetical protein
MDPYLEHPELWPSVHTELIVALRHALVSLLPASYFVTVELREYEITLAELELLGIGDVSVTRERETVQRSNGPQYVPSAEASPQSDDEHAPAGPTVLTVEVPRLVPVRERYLEIRHPPTHELITMIEILSPTNKRSGKGRQQYEEKRQEIVSSLTNLVEIDLVRTGEPLPVRYQGTWLPRDLAGDYRVLISHGGQRRHSQLFPISLRERLPSIPIPLRPHEDQPMIDLQTILQEVYDAGAYERALNYRQEPVPPLAPEDAAWADRLLRDRGLR